MVYSEIIQQRPSLRTDLGQKRLSYTLLNASGFSPHNGHHQTSPIGPVRADIVAKAFLGWRAKILRAADALYTRQREGPYRFIQNRSRTSVVTLKSDAAAEKSKDQLSRDFLGRSIFDFCNKIGTQRTNRVAEIMSVLTGGADVAGRPSNRRE
jgi:hypothetical protein